MQSQVSSPSIISASGQPYKGLASGSDLSLEKPLVDRKRDGALCLEAADVMQGTEQNVP